MVWKPKCVCFNNKKIEGNEGLMLVVLNCTLLHNKNDHKTLVTTNPRRVTSQKNEDFKTHLGINVKLLIFLPDFNQIWNFQDNFSQTYPVSNFKEIRPVVVALIHADRQTWQRWQPLVATRKTRLKLLHFPRSTLGCSKRSLQEKAITSPLSTGRYNINNVLREKGTERLYITIRPIVTNTSYSASS
jgi:hypothetical protein